jgi:hypothetical protein
MVSGDYKVIIIPINLYLKMIARSVSQTIAPLFRNHICMVTEYTQSLNQPSMVARLFIK